MAYLTPEENLTLSRLLEKKRGFVLDFDKNSFIDFFRDEFEVDITSHPYYGIEEYQHKDIPNFIGCLRTFFERESNQRVGKAIELLVGRAERLHKTGKDNVVITPEMIKGGYAIARRLQGRATSHVSGMTSVMLKNHLRLIGTQAKGIPPDILFPSSLALPLARRARAKAALSRSIHSPEVLRVMERYQSQTKRMARQARPTEEDQKRLNRKARSAYGDLKELRRPPRKSSERINRLSSRRALLRPKLDVSLESESEDAALYNAEVAHEARSEASKNKDNRSIIDGIGEIDFDKFPVEEHVKANLKARFNEAVMCFDKGIYFPAVTTAGAVLECVLLGYAMQFPQKFNQSKSCPKNKTSGKPLPFARWGLSRLIDVARELGFINKTMQQHCYCLRDYRNYIHPYEQLHGDEVTKETADISLRILFHTLRSLMAK